MSKNLCVVYMKGGKWNKDMMMMMMMMMEPTMLLY